MDRVIQMIMNAVLRQLINRGIKTGMNYATRNSNPDDDTPANRQQSQDAKAMAKRARQAANLGRRLGR
jgi:hypothetical protein